MRLVIILLQKTNLNCKGGSDQKKRYLRMKEKIRKKPILTKKNTGVKKEIEEKLIKFFPM
jgi:methionine synthase I (cobalamin-dependent)